MRFTTLTKGMAMDEEFKRSHSDDEELPPSTWDLKRPDDLEERPLPLVVRLVSGFAFVLVCLIPTFVLVTLLILAYKGLLWAFNL